MSVSPSLFWPAAAALPHVGGKGSYPRAYAKSRLPARGKCTIEIALDKLALVNSAISVGVVLESLVGEQPCEAVGVFSQEAGSSYSHR